MLNTNLQLCFLFWISFVEDCDEIALHFNGHVWGKKEILSLLVDLNEVMTVTGNVDKSIDYIYLPENTPGHAVHYRGSRAESDNCIC